MLVSNFFNAEPYSSSNLVYVNKSDIFFVYFFSLEGLKVLAVGQRFRSEILIFVSVDGGLDEDRKINKVWHHGQKCSLNTI